MRDAVSLLKRGLIASVLLGLVLMGCAGASTSARPATPESLAKLQKVEVKETAESTMVVITLDKEVQFTSVRMPEPPRMVVDLAGVDMGGFSGTTKVDKPPVSEIKTVKVPNAPRIGRLEIGLMKNVDLKTTQNGGVITILFEKPAPVKQAEAKESPAPETGGKETAAKEPAAKDAQAKDTQVKDAKAYDASITPPDPTAKAAASVPAAPVQVSVKPSAALPPAKTIKDITSSKHGDSYQVRIVADGTLPKPESFMLGKDRIVIDVPGVSAVKDKGVINVGGKPLKAVRMAAHKDKPAKVRVVLDLASPAEYELKPEGGSLVVTISPAGKPAVKAAPAPAPVKAAATAPKEEKPVAKADKPAPKAEAPVAKAEAQVPKTEAKAEAKPEAKAKPAPARKDGINVYVSKDGRAVLSSSPIEDKASLAKVEDRTRDYVETQTKIYTGGRISFDIQDADLDNVIKLLADVANLNLILDPAEVKGKVTLKLDNVPWDQALDILLRIYNLDKVIEGNVLRVASKARLDDERRRDLLQVAEQKKLEQQAQDLYTKTFKVNFMTASELEPQVKKILSNRGDATANPRTNELVVTDIRENLDKAGRLIAVLDKEVKQIMIEARLVTVNVGYTQSLGVSWGMTKKSSTTNPNIGAGTNGETVNSDTSGPNGSHSYQLDLPAAVGAPIGGFLGAFSWGSIFKDVNIDLTISALESIDKAETLAAPKVFTLENQPATITSGTTIYVQTTTAAGTAPQPLNANLSLTVTPRVTGDNFIVMDVTATNNTPSNSTFGGVAAINTQQVTTRVLVKDGETIVLGGIYTKSRSKNSSHVPLLGRLPIIGYLFSTKDWNDQTSELLIFITPKLMLAANQV